MKTKNFKFFCLMGSLALVAAVVSPQAWASNMSSRDLQADAALSNDAGWGGVLPPTGGPIASALIAPQAGAGVDPFKPRVLPSGIQLTVVPDDQKAQVYELTGKARYQTGTDPDWKPLKKGDLIQKGDTLLTSKQSRVSLTLDAALQNVVFIPENTKAVFHSLEPTEISLEDGTIYNIVNKIPEGSYWKVQTPVAVAAVRGTWWFVSYAANDGSYASGIFDDTNQGVDSIVEIIKDDVPLNIPEGFQIQLQEGQAPDPALLEKVDPQWVEQVSEVLQGVAELQNTDESTGGPAGGGNDLNDAGNDDSGGLGDQLPELDPQDTGSIQTFEESFPEPEPVEEPVDDCNNPNCPGFQR